MCFGNDDTCCTATANLEIFDVAGPIATITVAVNTNDQADQSIGPNSDEFETSMAIRRNAGTGLSTYIDYVQFSVAGSSAPLPGTLAMLVLDPADVGAARRRV